MSALCGELLAVIMLPYGQTSSPVRCRLRGGPTTLTLSEMLLPELRRTLAEATAFVHGADPINPNQGMPYAAVRSCLPAILPKTKLSGRSHTNSLLLTALSAVDKCSLVLLDGAATLSHAKSPCMQETATATLRHTAASRPKSCGMAIKMALKRIVPQYTSPTAARLTLASGRAASTRCSSSLRCPRGEPS